jgi:hypothetical protein
MVRTPQNDVTITQPFQYEKDTFFCGNTYYKLTVVRNAFLRVDSNKVYARKTTDCQRKEYIMYDFSLNPGDSLFCGYILSDWPQYDIDTAFMFVAGVDTIENLGVKRKRLHMKFDVYHGYGQFPWYEPMDLPDMYWIEGVGSDYGPFYSFLHYGDHTETENELLCLDSANTTVYRAFNFCDIHHLGIENSEENQHTTSLLFPNPSSRFLQISVNDPSLHLLSAYLFNTTGYVILSCQFQPTTQHATLNTQYLPSGIYVCHITLSNGEKTVKKVLVE